MRLVVPTNWQKDLIEKISKPGVDTVYGKLDSDFVGGGRPSCVLERVSKKNAALHIGQVHKRHMNFFYLLNSSCMGNTEWTRRGEINLRVLLDWLSAARIDGVVVASPYLLQYIKRNYPHFRVSVSCFANVNSVEKARFWEDLGASIITLSQVEINRNFGLLKKIRENVKCELQLLVNDNCLQDCPLFFYHNNMTSHASQDSNRKGSYIFDYCRLMCRSRMLKEPVNFIRAAWIRPEDLHIYENIGIDRFKLVDRSMHSDALALIVDAYSKRKYDGNLYDLFNNPSKSLWLNKPNFLHQLNYFFHPLTVNIFKILKHKDVVKDIDVYIDNTKLDGFINYFLNQDCRYRSCKECGYCQEIAEKVVKINHESTQKDIRKYDALLQEITSGDIYRY